MHREANKPCRSAGHAAAVLGLIIPKSDSTGHAPCGSLLLLLPDITPLLNTKDSYGGPAIFTFLLNLVRLICITLLEHIASPVEAHPC